MQHEFWAKSSGVSLLKHTSDVLQAVDILRQNRSKDIPDEWWIALQYAALLHDLGKIDPSFQQMLKKTETTSFAGNIPHSFLSLFLFRPELFNFSDPTVAHIVVSAVAFHHWRESFPDLLMGTQSYDVSAKAKEIFEQKSVWSKRCQEIADQLGELAQHYGLDKEVVGLNEVLIDYLRFSTLGSAGILSPPYTLAFLPASIRGSRGKTEEEKFRIFVTGNLMRADHFSSLVEDGGGQLGIQDIEKGEALSAQTVDNRMKDLFRTNRYWQQKFFTDRPKLQGESMILVAPTGFGKTEFAYLWGAGKKNLMLLPMRAATNKIFDRTQALYGEEQVALLHADASLELFTRSQRRNVQETEGQRRKAIDLARHLARPYIVATADQIVPSVLRYPGYERIFSVLMDGGLVIDEIQAYDPRAAAIVTCLLQQNDFLGGKTLLMTATLPPFIQKQITKRLDLPGEQVINLLDLAEFKGAADSTRHRVQFLVHNGNYDTVTPEVINGAVSGKKVLVIMNTVAAACAIYEQIKSELEAKALQVSLVLLHSRFTAQQRREIEILAVDQLMPNSTGRDQAPCIIISTQIVEASLDIDADLMFTEPAPADSLVQRMGRVYRRYARGDGPESLENANVFIIIDKSAVHGKHKSKDKKPEDAGLGSGIGTVYNRDLTVISLVVLASYCMGLPDEGVSGIILEEEPWKPCFRPRKGQKNKAINKALCGIINGLDVDSILLNERQKVEWVEQTYILVDKASDPNYPLNLGNYIKRYLETLEILDHGYCSDKRRDAMRLFREVNDITGIPVEMVDDFNREIRSWVNDNFPKLNYAELATTILPKYLVACPYRSVVTWEGNTHYRELDLTCLIPTGFSVSMQANVYDKMERWLSGIVVLELQYDTEKGLNYFDP